MRSPSDYWEYFVAAQSHYFGTFVEDMAHLRVSDGWLAAMGAVLFLFALEFVLPWRRRQRKLRPGLATDVFYLLFNNLFMWGLFASAIVGLLTLLFRDALAAIGVTNLVAIQLDGMQMWARFLLMFLVGDLIGYFGHWVLHRVDFLWAFHKVHHSSKQLDVWNAQRFHLGEQIFWPIFNYLPFGLIGWPAGEVFAYGVLGSLLSSFSHTNARVPLGPLK
jgi:sterol desaturase/sphingolipid hydroxylase (fatty acid hydroxylase superfamily)